MRTAGIPALEAPETALLDGADLIRKTLLLLTALMFLGSHLPMVNGQAGGAGVVYELIVVCPTNPRVTLSLNTEPGCPIRATDGSDLMGDPSLAVDPLRPEDLILSSLHGQNYPGEGPDAKSRRQQIFTTFTSDTAGVNWVDNPYYPPDDLPAATRGQHVQATIDPYGHVFIGSLYAIPNGDQFEYVVGAQKFESLDTIVEEQRRSNGDYNVDYLLPVHEGNRISQFWFLFNPRTDNMTVVWNEQIPVPSPCQSADYITFAAGHYLRGAGSNFVQVWEETNGMAELQTPESCPENPDTQILASKTSAEAESLLTLQPASASGDDTDAAPPVGTPASAPVEGALQFRASPMQSHAVAAQNATPDPNRTMNVIGVVWTSLYVDSNYTYQKPEWVIGPCDTSTNPVLSDGFLYVGCVVGAHPDGLPFEWRPEAEVGDVELFRMDPNGGEPVYMGNAPDMPGAPKLGVRSDGRLALVAAGASEDGLLTFKAAFGHYKEANGRIIWSGAVNLGEEIYALDPAIKFQAGNIQDVIFREQSGVLHIILKTTIQYVEQTVGDVQDDLGLAPHIRKIIIAVDEQYGLVGKVPLVIGDPLQRSRDPTIFNAPEGAFQDLSDDFLQLPPEPFAFAGRDLGDEYQREFFAIADYGTILFAELVEVTELRAPGVAPPPAPPPPVPAPAAANIAAPVAGGIVASLVAGTLAANRRKNPAAAFAKGE